MTVVQISPTYPPDISGVGDYAALLAMELRDAGQSLETLVAGTAGWSVAREGEVAMLDRPDAAALAAALTDARKVLLHFSGYGYARRGLCRWLVDGLALWKSVSENRRLVTMFHEVYATGPIWRSSFWTAGAQRRIARDLTRLSDAAFVSSKGGHDQLRPLCETLPLEVLEVFSNVGERASYRSLFERPPAAVVFGGPSRRRQVYEALNATNAQAAEILRYVGVEKILDIGPPIDCPEATLGCRIETLGPLPADDVSTYLDEARIGFVNYRRDKITKSGIAAGYFSHGVLVVNTQREGYYPDNLVEGVHVVDLGSPFDVSQDFDVIAAAGWKRYKRHDLHVTAKKICTALALGSEPFNLNA